MVVLELGRSNERLLAFAASLARRLGISLVGVAVCQPMAAVYDQTMILGDFVQEDRDELDTEVKTAKAEFEGALTGKGIDLGWHSMVTIGSLCDYTVARARAADIILCATGDEQMPVTSRRAGISDMVMHAGRPVLLVPSTVGTLALDHAVVAWKDAREARRAIADALPLLKLARKVTVIEIADEAELSDATLRLTNLVEWLGRHRITANASPVLGVGDDAGQLARFMDNVRADLTVAGAYGHSRVREWVLGGVTRDLLLSPSRCALLSH
jgi:nucleotide-binding universal stress UspA family protein